MSTSDQPVRKPFDQNLLDENDPKSREVVKKYFLSIGITLIDNPDKYGVDLIGVGSKLKVEVERRNVWKTGQFPYAEVNVPERKAKFFRNLDTCYVIVSEDYAYLGGLNPKDTIPFMKDAKENRNKYVGSGELFYKVPRDKFKWIKI